MRILQLTPETTRNPFYTMLVPYLEAQGVEVTFDTDLARVVEAASGGEIDIVHLHQLDQLYRPADAQTADDRAANLMDALIEIRMSGVALVYTLHNRQPHNGRFVQVDSRLHRFLAEAAQVFIVLGDCAVEAAKEWVPTNRVRVMPHPSYEGHYGPEVPKSGARRNLAISQDEWIVLSLGELKPYKGHELIFSAFQALRMPERRLIIVGRNADAEYTATLESLTFTQLERARLVVRDVPDDEIAVWLGASDVAVFGFSEVLVSGSVMLSLSYGVPVVAPAVGCLGEVIKEGENGFLYSSGDVYGLARCLNKVYRNPPDPANVRASIREQLPQTVAKRLRDIYGEILT